MNERPLAASKPVAWWLLLCLGLTGCRDSGQPRPLPQPRVASGEMSNAQIADRVQATWLRLDGWTQQNLPEISRTLNIPATPEQIARAEERLKVRFPVDFRASLESRNGQRRGQFLFRYQLLPVVTIERANQPPEGVAGEELAQREREMAAELWKKTPESHRGRIKEDAQVLRRWIRVAAAGDDYLALDLDPGPKGFVGQVVCVGPNTAETRVIARSWADLLIGWADILQSGQYEIDKSGETPLLKPKDGAGALETLERAAAHAEGK